MQAEDVAVAEISPDGNFMFEFLLGFLVFIFVLTLDLLANNFDGSNDAVSCPRVERVNFLYTPKPPRFTVRPMMYSLFNPIDWPSSSGLGST